jgi:hypothetical protein
MSVTDAAVQEAGPRPHTERIVNDFAIQVATVNGSAARRPIWSSFDQFLMGVLVAARICSRRTS